MTTTIFDWLTSQLPNPFLPRPAKNIPFVVLLCQHQTVFTHVRKVLSRGGVLARGSIMKDCGQLSKQCPTKIPLHVI